MTITYQSRTVPIISLRPDWSGGIRFGQHCATTITEALNSKEHRQSRRPRALYSLDYVTQSLSAAETEYVRRLIETADDLPVGCPLWPLACKLTAAASVTDTSLAVDDSDHCLFNVFHQYAILWQSFNRWEIVALSSVGQTSIILASGLEAGFDAGAQLMPIAFGHVPRSRVGQLTDEHGSWQCRFSERFVKVSGTLGVIDQSVPEVDPPEPPVIDDGDGGGGGGGGGGGDFCAALTGTIGFYIFNGLVCTPDSETPGQMDKSVFCNSLRELIVDASPFYWDASLGTVKFFAQPEDVEPLVAAIATATGMTFDVEVTDFAPCMPGYVRIIITRTS
ncbi:MAG TPA: hypothetical protein PKA41_10195 [Verrucomicrobiota bacterium]|nr:hypothetical protein [Verrucomicrobiota bacterium]